jgi:amino acid transporter
VKGSKSSILGQTLLFHFRNKKWSNVFHNHPSDTLLDVNASLALGLIMLGMALGSVLTFIAFKGHAARQKAHDDATVGEGH